MEFIGIQKETHFYRLAYLSIVQGEAVIHCLEKEQSLPKINKKFCAVTGIEGKDLLLRHLTSPLEKKKALQKTLPFQLEPLIPYALDEVVVKPLFYQKKDETEADFYCIPKEVFVKHLQSYEEEGLDPDWVSTVPSALHRFATFVAPEESSLIVFHVGMKKIQIISIHESRLSSHITLHMGAEDLSKGDSEKIVEKLKREVNRALCFMAHKEEMGGNRKVLFCGEKTNEVKTLLNNEGALLEVIDIEGHRGFSGESVRPYAISIGLALDALKNDPFSIQFRQEDYISKRTYTTLKKGLIQGGALAALLFLMTSIFSSLIYSKKEQALINEVDQILSVYETELTSLKKGKEGQSLESLLINVNQQLRVPKRGEHLYESPPLVSDVLAFISTHPMLQEIDVKGLDYTLTRYPTIKNPTDSYRPKVRLVFYTEEAKKARAFHDAIVDEDTYVDKDEEIEWKRNENEYEIAFFLRI